MRRKPSRDEVELEVERGEGEEYCALTVRVVVAIEVDGRDVYPRADAAGFTKEGEQVPLLESELTEAEDLAAQRWIDG
jgi:hypothetical protein